MSNLRGAAGDTGCLGHEPINNMCRTCGVSTGILPCEWCGEPKTPLEYCNKCWDDINAKEN